MAEKRRGSQVRQTRLTASCAVLMPRTRPVEGPELVIDYFVGMSKLAESLPPSGTVYLSFDCIGSL